MTDRRQARRYPVVLRGTGRFPKVPGLGVFRGRTLDLSTTGVLFEVDGPLPDFSGVHAVLLQIDWPAQLEEHIAIRLCVRARAVRIEGRRFAARILQHEFRLRGPCEAAA